MDGANGELLSDRPLSSFFASACVLSADLRTVSLPEGQTSDVPNVWCTVHVCTVWDGKSDHGQIDIEMRDLQLALAFG